MPDCLHNHGNYVVGLGAVVKWLAEQAEGLGVEIFPGFAAAEVLYAEDGSVRGVATGNLGLGKDGQPTDHFQLGMELLGKYTVFAEGARGHLGKQLIARFKLDEGRDPQSYALGIKELWEIDPAKATPGPGRAHRRLADGRAHLRRRLSLPPAGQPGHRSACVTGLDYQNPWLSPFEEMQRWKTHPAIRTHLEGGKRIGYGARAITAGGLLSLPKLVFPGGALVGCDAGTLNAARIKGSHAAIKTGMLRRRGRRRGAEGRPQRRRARAPTRRPLTGAGCSTNSSRRATSSSGSSRATRSAR